MTVSNKHIIGRLLFDVEYQNEQKTMDLQEKISSMGKEDIPDILEASLNKFDKNYSYLVIDRLTLELGKINTEDLQNQLILKFKRELDKQLNDITSADPPLQDTTKLDDDQSRFYILKYFLRTGRLPWFIEQVNFSLEDEFADLLYEEHEQFIHFIKENIQDVYFRQRLIFQFEENFVLDLLKKIYPERVDRINSIRYTFPMHYKIFISSGSSIQSFEKQLFEALVDTVVYKTEHAEVSDELIFLAILLSKLKTEPSAVISRIKLFMSESIKEDKQSSATFEKIASILSSDEEEVYQIIKSFKTLKEKEMTYMSDNKPPVNDISERRDIEPEKQGEQTYYIQNAGLVLLNPFIPELFKRLKLVSDQKFTGEHSIYKAIHLLEYIVHGNIKKFECILLLNKILCGHNIIQPVPVDTDLSRYEKAEGTKMLKAVIKNWPALKSTSVSGFNRSFLQRPGILKLNTNKWKLYVERRTYDLLLNRLPWSFQLIKYPWMDKIIEVEW